MAEPDAPERPMFGLGAKLVLVALAAFGLVMMVNWVIGLVFGLLKFILLLVVIVGIVAAVRAVTSRR